MVLTKFYERYPVCPVKCRSSCIYLWHCIVFKNKVSQDNMPKSRDIFVCSVLKFINLPLNRLVTPLSSRLLYPEHLPICRPFPCSSSLLPSSHRSAPSSKPSLRCSVLQPTEVSGLPSLSCRACCVRRSCHLWAEVEAAGSGCRRIIWRRWEYLPELLKSGVSIWGFLCLWWCGAARVDWVRWV